jgi:CubicO group peptidase (beta-lactamase class C family)
MTLRLLCILSVAAALAGPLSGRAEEPPADPSQPAIDAYVKQQMDAQHIPGLSLAVTIDNELIFTKGYGLANVELQSPALDETVYEVASLTKQFTALAVLLLAQDGKLALDDPIRKYFPEAPATWDKITLRHLLTHTSGIPDFDDAGQGLDPRREYTKDELVHLAGTLPLKFAPGARWSYSNTAYVLLGVLVHRVSGKHYGDFLRERVFSPLHMGSTRVNSGEDLIPFRASGYELDEGRLKNQAWLSSSLGETADGGLVSSVVDLAKWDSAIQSGALLPPGRWQEVFTPVTLNSGKTFPYGFGWFIREQAGHPYYEHSGRLQGFASHILRFPGARVSVIVLANLAQADPWQIAHGVASIIRPDLKPPEDHPLGDQEPAVTARLRQVLDGLRRGQLDDAAFTTEGRNAYNADVLNGVKDQLSKLPPFGGFELVNRAEVGDDTEYRYWVEVGAQKWLLAASIETDSGKVERFDFNPL